MQTKLQVLTFFLLSFICGSIPVFSQDSIPKTSNLKEENFLNFQDHFFKALAQKSIYNYRVAIQNLEKCNELKPKNVSVLFEMSKNYLMLKKFFEAEEFAKQALAIEQNNYWVLEHLSKLYVASRNIKKAIPIHEKIAELNPKEREQLVYLYYQDNQKAKAKALLSDLEKQRQLTPNLISFKKRFIETTSVKKATKTKGLQELIKEFEKDKSFESLHKILTLSSNTNAKVLLSYSEKGLELYPAQAFVYLMNGKAQNQNNNFKKALEQLTNGIDFVIDNNSLAADFYEEIAKSYNGLGNKEEAIKNKNKALTLRKK
jgi:tetratricopeptide (TPR) repeat protein